MRQPGSHRLTAIAFMLAGTGACATLKPPATNSGPVLSANGVEMTVVRQLCAETQYGTLETLVNETVELQVRNGSPGPVTLHRDRIHLIGPDGGAYSSGASPTDLLSVPTGQTQTFELTFAARGLNCTKTMRVDPGAGITSQQAPVALQPVSFVPL